MVGKISSYLNTKDKVYLAMSVTCLNGQCDGEVQDCTNRFGLTSSECGIAYGCEKKFCGCTECMDHFTFCPNSDCSTIYCKDCLGNFSGCMFDDDGSCKVVGCWECCKMNMCAGCDKPLCKKHSIKSPCCGKRYCRVEEMLECCDGAPMS